MNLQVLTFIKYSTCTSIIQIILLTVTKSLSHSMIKNMNHRHKSIKYCNSTSLCHFRNILRICKKKIDVVHERNLYPMCLLSLGISYSWTIEFNFRNESKLKKTMWFATRAIVLIHPWLWSRNISFIFMGIR